MNEGIRRVAAVMMVQVASTQTRHYRSLVRNLVYQALMN